MSPGWVLALYAVFFMLVFVLRTVVQLRSTGRSGFKGISGRPLSAEWWGGVLFVVAIVLGVGAPLAALWGWSPSVALPGWSVGLGLVLYGLGVAGTLAAQLGMGSSWRIGVDENERTALVTGGLFGVVRNPIFSFLLVTATGLGLLVANAVSALAVAVLLVAVELQVRRVEEPYLLRTHGAAYAGYAARVGRFLPFLGTLRTDRKYTA